MTDHDCPKNKAAIIRGKIVEGCEKCISSLTRPNELAAANRRNWQQKEYRRDIVQSFEPGYVKARGVDAAREAGWSDEAIRKYS